MGLPDWMDRKRKARTTVELADEIEDMRTDFESEIDTLRERLELLQRDIDEVRSQTEDNTQEINELEEAQRR